MSWNVRGLNSEAKWNSIRDKIQESKCEIVCLQETKRDNFVSSYIKNFCPLALDAFAFLPSVGASGGILVVWKSAVFGWNVVFVNEYAISVEFISKFNGHSWVLTSVYAPCTYSGKRTFLSWFREIQMLAEVDWLVVGDFNLLRRPEDRSREGADPAEMFLFNEVINKLSLVEIPLHGRQFTWSNKQLPPLLERLDWFFSSNSWTLSFPNTFVRTLVMETSDHWPCILEIGTNIPQSKNFHFENYWLNMDRFIDTVVNGWAAQEHISDPAMLITAKFKNLRRSLKAWNKQIPNMFLVISNIKLILNFLKTIELLRNLTLPEWNFRNIISERLILLLKQQRTFWKQRSKIKWVKEGDAGTKFFHAHATISHRKNTITSVQDGQGINWFNHEEKEKVFWEIFKNRLGFSDFSSIHFDMSSLIQPSVDLGDLELPFTKEEIDGVVSQLPNDKSPGPDGFSNEFIKICWPLIAEDFYRLCQAFFLGTVNLKSINSSFITLIPKIDGPQLVSDYRPISLLNSSLKLLTKILANRLQGKIRSLVHKNQYGFIKD